MIKISSHRYDEHQKLYRILNVLLPLPPNFSSIVHFCNSEGIANSCIVLNFGIVRIYLHQKRKMAYLRYGFIFNIVYFDVGLSLMVLSLIWCFHRLRRDVYKLIFVSTPKDVVPEQYPFTIVGFKGLLFVWTTYAQHKLLLVTYNCY